MFSSLLCWQPSIKIHLHLFFCQLSIIRHTASSFGSWKDYFFQWYRVTFSNFPVKAPKISCACTKNLKMYVFEPGRNVSLYVKREVVFYRPELLGNATKEGCNSWKWSHEIVLNYCDGSFRQSSMCVPWTPP